MGKWLLECVEVTGGFLPGLELRFPPGLTCIIGPRGSGKSTLIEALRYGLCGASGISKARADLIQANLGSANITIRTASDGQGIAYLIRRTYRQPPVLSTVEGKAVGSVDLDRGTFLPLDGYSSAEIEAIADESLGEKRRLLLDELRGEELNAILLTVSEQRRTLDANAEAIRAAQRLLTDLTEQIEELGDARARLALLPEPPEGAATGDLVRAAKQHQVNAEEMQSVAGSLDIIARCQAALPRVMQDCRDQLAGELVVRESANADFMIRALTSIDTAWAAIAAPLAAIESALEGADTALRQVQAELTTIHTAQEAEYKKSQERDLAASEAIRERTAAEQALAKLASLEARREETRRELQSLLKTRESLKAAYLLERERISELREQVAANLQREVGPKVRIRVLRNADSLKYQQLLSEGLRGARVRNHDDILAGLLTLRPEQLAQLVHENDLDEFDGQLSLGKERSRKVLDAFRENLDPLSLEVVDIEDRVCIELNVSPSAELNFKDAAELSRGQKCTALLPLLLARRNTPLVIDQPEDNLDNHFIYETVVETIRRLKPSRQMVFVTHNANIPVLAEADLVVVMNSDGKKGIIQKAGTLDACRDEIIDLLEGGEEAFELRRKRYAR